MDLYEQAAGHYSQHEGHLVDWLVEVDEEYKLQTEILFISVSY